MNGTVKWFNNKRGYGFITGEDSKEYFVHYSNIISDKEYKSLKPANSVTFDPNTREDGKLCATNVMRRITPKIEKKGAATNEN